jgi:hypothetical protein
MVSGKDGGGGNTTEGEGMKGDNTKQERTEGRGVGK